MQFSKVYRLLVNPQVRVDIVESEKWMMVKSDEYLLEYGMKKHLESIEKGAKFPTNPRQWYNTKRRYHKYIDYKKNVAEEARRVLYMPRTDNFWVKFYLPMPKSWSRKKRNILAWEPHLKTKDTDNLVKGFIDGLFPDQDSIVWDYRATKFWTPSDNGFIDIEIGTLPPAKANVKSLIYQTDELK